MFRYVCLLLISLVLADPLVAQHDGTVPIVNKDDIWRSISERDFTSVEQAFANSHTQYLHTKDNPDRTRHLYEIFVTNSPEVTKFATDWLEAYPNSPYAHTAITWIYYNTAWYIRGDGFAREIYPDALAEFKALHNKALYHAEQAYAADPSFLQASDALLRLANSTGQDLRAFKVLQKVMKEQPNMGTLRRALQMTMPGWGGSWEMAENICEHYAPMIDWDKSDPVIYCKLIAAGEFYPNAQEDWLRETLKTGAYPDFDHLRLRWATLYSATKAEAEIAREYLNRDGVTDVKYSRRFDENVAHRYDFDFVSEIHLRRAQADARKALVRDPYNPRLIKIMQKTVSRMSRTETAWRSTVVERLTQEEEIEYARRLLVASPYNPKYWQDYARIRFQWSYPENFMDDEPYLIIEIVYSNHHPGNLNAYIFSKWRYLAALKRLDTDPQSEAWQKLDKDRQAAAEKQRQRWLALRDRTDLDRKIRCPMMRAYHLHKFICKGSTDFDCSIQPEHQEMFEIVRADVNKRRVCTGVMSAPEQELFYLPNQLDLSPPG